MPRRNDAPLREPTFAKDRLEPEAGKSVTDVPAAVQILDKPRTEGHRPATGPG